MFCGNCGSKIEDGAKFCAACGTPTGITEQTAAPVVEPVRQTVEQTAAPVVEPVQQTVEQTAAPVVEPVRQTVEQAAAPVVEPVRQTVEQAAAPVVEPVRQTVEQTAAPVVEPVQQTVEQAAAPVVEPVRQTVEQAAAPVVEPVQQTFEQPVQSVQQTFTQPVQPAFGNTQPAAPVKPKKKGKGGLIAGLTAAAVVIGGAGVGYFGFHNKITKLVMGDIKYAQMIERSALSELESTESNTEKAVSGISEPAVNAVSLLKTTNTDPDSEGSNGIDRLLMFMDPDSMGSMFENLPDNTELTVKSNLNIEPGSVFAFLNDESVKSILDAVNNLTFVQSATNSETDFVRLGIMTKDGTEGSVQIYRQDDGILLTFPGISEQKIYVSEEDIKNARSQSGIETTGSKKIDPDELKRVVSEIKDIYADSFETAEITYTDSASYENNIVSGDGTEISVSVKGMEVKTYFDSEHLQAMCDKVMEKLGSDAYLTEYFTKTFGFTADEYKKFFEKKEDSGKLDMTLTVSHIVDVHNNVLSTSYNLSSSDSKNSICADYAKSGNNSFVSTAVKSGDGNDFTLNIGKNEPTQKEATELIQLVSGANGGIDLMFKCSCHNMEEKQFLGRKIRTGQYSFAAADPDKFGETLKKLLSSMDRPEPDYPIDYNEGVSVGGGTAGISGSDSIYGLMSADSAQIAGNDSIINELKKLTVSADISLENDTYTTVMTVSAGDIGKITDTTSMTRADKTESMPDTSGAIRLGDSAENAEALVSDAFDWLGNFAGRLDGGEGLISQAASSLAEGYRESREAAEKNKKYLQHYSAYTEWSIYDASSYAYQINDGLREAVVAAMENGVDSGTVKLYFKGGKAQILDDGGVTGINYENEELDSVYAEVFFAKGVWDFCAVGTNVVFTDDPADIPDGLPTIYNFIDNVYPDATINDGYLGEYVVGFSSYFIEGTPTTTEIPSPEPGDEPVNDPQPSDDETGYDGTWSITAFNGLSLSDYMEQNGMDPIEMDLYVTISGDTVTLVTDDSGTGAQMTAVYGKEYEGTPAAALLFDVQQQSEDEPSGYLVFDSENEIRLVDVYIDATYTLERTDEPVNGGNDEDPDSNEGEYADIDVIAGVWYDGTEGNEETVTIGTNYLLTPYTEYWLDNYAYYLLNPEADGYGIYSDGDRIGTVSYMSGDDTLAVVNDSTGENRIMTRVESAPARFDYAGSWTMETYEGMSVDEWCELNSSTPDDFAMNLDIGEYGVVVSDSTGEQVWTVKNPTEDSIQIAFDSSMFLDCIYDGETEKLTCVMRFDDNRETQTAVFTRGTHAFG